jgi:hypothetical protein
MKEAFECRLPVCEWCRLDCENDYTVCHCSCPNHDGETATFCSPSCKAAAHA